MKVFIHLIFASFLAINVYGQGDTQISGTVTSFEDDEPLPGVSIYVKGTTIGTITDLDGEYNFTVPANTSTLVFSFIGFATEEIDITGKTQVNLSMVPDIISLGEIVVTALGIKKEERALGYASQQVKGEDLTQAKEINVINSLSGKVAGVSINQAGTGPGGTSKIVIRGYSSISGDNSPLIVLDGVPMNNPQGGGERTGDGGRDYGDGLSNINADDIESMSVLKGASATALYGSRGQNGVIMITTKKGTSRKGIGVSVNTSFVLETPQVLPDFQNTYGRGTQGRLPLTNAGDFADDVRTSWGAPLQGQTEANGNPLVNWTGNPTAYSPQPDNIKDFFETGKTFTTGVTMTGGTEKSQGLLSISRMENDGIMPNSSLERTTVNLRINHQLTDKFSFDGKVNYVNQEAFNRPNLTLNPDNPMNSLIQMPRSIRLEDLKNYRNADGSPRLYTNAKGTDNWQNPYWAVNLNTNNDRRDRVIGFVSLKYDFTKWASLMVRSGSDLYYDRLQDRRANGTIYITPPNKSLYMITDQRIEERNSDFLLMLTPQVTDNIGLDINIGGNIRKNYRESLSSQGQALNVPNHFVIDNVTGAQTSEGLSEKEVQSLYGTMSLDFKRIFFVELSGRNDWSSTLPANNRSYFYPSVSSSFVFTDAFGIDSDVLSYGKIRGSLAAVGSDADPYQLQTLYSINAGYFHGGQQLGQIVSVQAPVDLKPERTTSFETGFILDFFNTRLYLDATYYNAGTRDQIFNAETSKASGFTAKKINGGLVRNQGVEVLLKGKIIEGQNFGWDATLNFSKNVSKIVELSEGVNVITQGKYDQFGVTIQSEVGEPFGNIYANKTYLRDPETGQRIIREGLPVSDPEGGLQKIGNFQPDWLAGLKNNFSYKNFTLGVLIDMKKGGDIFSYSNAIAAWNGNAAYTEDQRAEWYAGAGGYVAEGVTADGTPNTKEVDPQAYWQTVGGVSANFAEEFIYDGTFVKLRELTVAYNMPKAMLERLPFTRMTFSLVGRNLFFIHKNTPGFDPEATFNSGNNQGIEAFAFPSTRSYGFNLNFSL